MPRLIYLEKNLDICLDILAPAIMQFAYAVPIKSPKQTRRDAGNFGNPGQHIARNFDRHRQENASRTHAPNDNSTENKRLFTDGLDNLKT